ncbi:MAG: hypothetical protein WD118_03015 [Phycisphaeraceae bacterium]
MIATLLTLHASLASPLASVAWVPLIEPMPIESFWQALLVPLAVAIAVVYKTIKIEDLRQLPRQAMVLTSQIVVLMALAAIVIWVLVEVT